MYKAVIVDDEKNCRDNLKGLLELYCANIEVVGTAENIENAFSLIKKCSPKILFLDIQMVGGDGFKLLQRLDGIEILTIFITAHEHFAIEAIKHSAFDYILKPIDIDALIATIKRAIDFINSNETKSHFDLNSVKKIALTTHDGFIYVDIDTIIRCESENYYTWIYFTNRPKMLITKTLKHFESILEPLGFIRIHNKHLVNKAHVTKYHSGQGGVITLTDESEIEVSFRKREQIFKLLTKL